MNWRIASSSTSQALDATSKDRRVRISKGLASSTLLQQPNQAPAGDVSPSTGDKNGVSHESEASRATWRTQRLLTT